MCVQDQHLERFVGSCFNSYVGWPSSHAWKRGGGVQVHVKPSFCTLLKFGSTCPASATLNLGKGWRWVVTITTPPALPPRKEPGYHWNRGWMHRRTDKNTSALAGESIPWFSLRKMENTKGRWFCHMTCASRKAARCHAGLFINTLYRPTVKLPLGNERFIFRVSLIFPLNTDS